MITKKTLKSFTLGLGFCLLPFHEAKAFHDDWLFGKSFFQGFDFPISQTTSNFVSHISETDKALTISFDVPGLSKEDINIHLKDQNVLVIDGKKETKKKKDEKTLYESEFSSRSFYQAFRLPGNVDTSKIDAEVKNGVLRIVVPKKPESKMKGKKIAIR
jgi:HSP20 family molecular chaperone IbpA